MKTDTFSLFQNLHPSPQTFPRYCQKKGSGQGGGEVNNYFQVPVLEFFFCYPLLHPNNQVNWSTRKPSHFQILGSTRELLHSKSFFPAASFMLLEEFNRRFVFRLMVEKSMHLYPMATKEKYEAYSLWIRVTKSLSWTEGVGEWLQVLEIECQEAACREIKGKQRDVQGAGCM